VSLDPVEPDAGVSALYFRAASLRLTDPADAAELESKISPDFRMRIDAGDPKHTHSVVVIHRVPEAEADFDQDMDPDIQSRHVALNRWTERHGRVQCGIMERFEGRTDAWRAGPAMRIGPIGDAIFPALRAELARDGIDCLADLPDVVAIVPDLPVQAVEPDAVCYGNPSPSEIKAGMTWGLEAMGIPQLWGKTRGAGVNVAVLDTGADGSHPALKNRVKAFIAIDINGKRQTRISPFDYAYHGTHVCGTIAGARTKKHIAIGVAPEVNLIVAATPIGMRRVYFSDILEGVGWAVVNHASVINMSFGFFNNAPYHAYSFLFRTLVQRFGILPVVAIGNNGVGTSGFPGNAAESFSAGAVFRAQKGPDVAPFSGGMSIILPGKPPPIVKPDVVAPGDAVYSCIPPKRLRLQFDLHAYASGTSMAAPHVTGSVALLMAAHPKAPISKIVEALKQTAYHPFGKDRRPDNRWGFGMIRPFDAHKALGS